MSIVIKQTKFEGLKKRFRYERLNSLETLRTLCENIFMSNPDVVQLEEITQGNGETVFILRGKGSRVIAHYETVKEGNQIS